MTKHLYLHEVQIALFQQLLAYETLLKLEYRMEITRYHSPNIFVIFLREHEYSEKHEEYRWLCFQSLYINCEEIKTVTDIDTEIKRIWDAIPAECKI